MRARDASQSTFFLKTTNVFGLCSPDRETIYVVVNIGESATSISMAAIEKGIIEFAATVGDAELGGQQFTECLSDDITRKYMHMFEIDPRKDQTTMQRCDQLKVGCHMFSFLCSNLRFYVKVDKLKPHRTAHIQNTRCKYKICCLLHQIKADEKQNKGIRSKIIFWVKGKSTRDVCLLVKIHDDKHASHQI